MKATQKMAGVVVLAVLMGGCASDQSYRPSGSYQSSSSSQPYSSDYGIVDSIQIVQGAGSSGTGAVLGGLVGGLLGNQIGSGSGRTAATVAGAVGGAVVGNQVEKNRGSGREMYQIGIRLSRGGYQTVTQDSIGDLRLGDRVRIENERVYRD